MGGAGRSGCIAMNQTMRLWLLGLGLVLAFWLLGAYNRLVRLRQAARTGFRPLVSQLRQRHAVAQALAQASRALLGEGSPLFEALEQAAAAAGKACDEAQSSPLKGAALLALGEAEMALGQRLEDLIHALQDLTSGEGPQPVVTELLRQRYQLHTQIVVSREVYHRAAMDYNDALGVFPTTLAAALFRFHPVPDLPLSAVPG